MDQETVEVGLDAFRMIRLEKFLHKVDKHAVRIVANMEHYRLSHLQQKQRDEEDDETCSSGAMRLFNQLRPYQLGGVEWMLSLHQHGANGILADEMGLGKTIQVIAFFLGLYQEFGVNGPHLIVGPMSVIGNWGAEIDKFANGQIDYHIHYGDKESREEELIRYISKRKRNVKTTIASTSSSSSKKVGNASSSNGMNKRHHSTSVGGDRDIPPISVIITSYELVIRDISMLGKRLNLWNGGIQYLVVDEAHRIKNRQSILYNKLLQLEVHHRMLLTGTPLQNNIQELWSLLSFILPGLFNADSDFQQWFNRPFEGGEYEVKIDSNNSATSVCSPLPSSPNSASSAVINSNKKKKIVYRLLNNDQLESSSTLTTDQRLKIMQSLHRALKPFFLRRVKSEVTIDLPTKVEKIIYCPMYPLQILLHEMLRKSIEHQEQEKLLRASTICFQANSNPNTPRSSYHNNSKRGGSSSTPGLSGLRQLLRDQDDGSNEMQFNNLVMQLRKICNHPYLLLEDIQSIPDEHYFRYLVSSCGKLSILNQLVNELLVKSPDSKILIFSQMTSTLNIIEGLLYNQGILSFRLDGNTAKVDRDLNIQRFSSTKPNCGNSEEHTNPRVFLLTTRAGGVGINLQAADTVIMYDSDWNPQQDLQAISRVHRIGQRRPVLVIRLITGGSNNGTTSVEEYMWKKAQRKLEAGNEVLGKNVFDMGTAARDALGDVEGEGGDTEEEDWADLMSDLNSIDGSGKRSMLCLFQAPSVEEPTQVASAGHNGCIRSNDSVNSFTTTHSEDSFGNLCDKAKSNNADCAHTVIQSLDEDALYTIIRRDLPDNSVEAFRIPSTAALPVDLTSGVCFDASCDEEELRTTWAQWLEHFKCGPSQENKLQSLLQAAGCIIAPVNVSDPQSTDLAGESSVATPTPTKSRRKSLMRIFEPTPADVWLDQDTSLQSPLMGDLFKGSSATRKRKHTTQGKSSRKGKKRSKASIADDDSSDDADDEDICCLCNEHVLSQEMIACITGEVNDIDEEIRDMMVLCDGCDGSYHLFCVGLHEVPKDDDWFCQFCVLTASAATEKLPLPLCSMSPVALLNEGVCDETN